MLRKGPLTDGQKAAVKLIFSERDRVVGVQGYAGTGKTTMLNRARCCSKNAAMNSRALHPRPRRRRSSRPKPTSKWKPTIRTHLTTQKTLYVEISRARHRAELVTDDRERLRERLEGATGERIAALESVEPGPEKRLDSGREAERGHERIEGPGVEALPVPETDAVREREAPRLEL